MRWIQCYLPGDASAVLGPTATWQILSALEAHVEGPLVCPYMPHRLSTYLKGYASPNGSGNGSRPPVKTFALFHHVGFLTSVARENQRDLELAGGEVVEELDGPVVPSGHGDGAVVADEVEWDGGDEPWCMRWVKGGSELKGCLPVRWRREALRWIQV